MTKKMFLRVLTLCFLLLLVIPSFPVDNRIVDSTNGFVISDFTPKRVLFDESHIDGGSSMWAPGNASLFSWIIGVHGYNSSTNWDSALDSGILDDFDILVIFFPQVALTSGEITAIKNFVTAGGSLLLVGTDSSNQWDFVSTNLNPLAEDYGVTFEETIVSADATDFITHDICTGVDILRTAGDQLFACSLDVSSPATSIISVSDQTVVAISESGAGRIAFVGTPAPFYMYRHHSEGFGEFHFQFSLNIIDWLAGNPQRDVTIPEKAIITAGNGPDLNSSQVEEYEIFVGTIHGHTTHSDGLGTPEEVIEKSLTMGVDFMVITDHSHNTVLEEAGVTGAPAAIAFVDEYNLDIVPIVGAELSLIKHSVGFPLTENIWTEDEYEGVSEIHAQGGSAFLAHPTIGYGYAPIYELMEDIGYDGLEIDNEGYFFGCGEDAYFWPFYGASDHHNFYAQERMFNVVFVKNPTGPNGSVADVDVQQAVLEKRNVILDRWNSMIFGQKVWVDRYLELYNQANASIQSAETLIQSHIDGGESIGLSEVYLRAAKAAFDYWNPIRALKLVENATSAEALEIDLVVTQPQIYNSDGSNEVVIELTNSHTNSISASTSLYVYTPSSMSVTEAFHDLEVDGESSASVTHSFNTEEYGLTRYMINVHSFDYDVNLMPIFFIERGVIDKVDYEIETMDSGDGINIRFWVGKDYAVEIESTTLIYDDGDGENTLPMGLNWHTYEVLIGPYTTETEITFHVEVVTTAGDSYVLAEQVATITPVGGLPLDFITLAILGIGLVAVVVVVLIVLKKRK